jgi:hypothetical protein
MAALSLACSRADSQRVVGETKAPAPPVDPIIGPDRGYHVDPSLAGGRIKGSVSFDGAAPVDTVVHPAVDADVCGQTLVDVTVAHHGPRLQGAVVWLDGVSSGKRMPIVRRYDLTSEGCQLVPRAQSAIVSGTLNVVNADQTSHLTRFVMSGTHSVLATILETEAGAVVPSRTVMTAPGLVEVKDDRHPWAKAWIAVFDQPYFATTGVSGDFKIDSVPPGRYRVSAWHERFGVLHDSVTVAAGGEAVVELRFRR